MNWILILEITISIIIGLKIFMFIYKTFNELTCLQIKTDQSMGNLDAIIKKKFNMIPSLIETVKDYVKHENSTFAEVTKLRSQWSDSKTANEKVKNANLLEKALSKLLVVQEEYPQLKANENFQSIQQSINLVESEIFNGRTEYNETVKDYNIYTRLFPKNIIAFIFRFRQRDFFSGKE